MGRRSSARRLRRKFSRVNVLATIALIVAPTTIAPCKHPIRRKLYNGTGEREYEGEKEESVKRWEERTGWVTFSLGYTANDSLHPRWEQYILQRRCDIRLTDTGKCIRGRVGFNLYALLIWYRTRKTICAQGVCLNRRLYRKELPCKFELMEFTVQEVGDKIKFPSIESILYIGA
jgi:hypothetical protein